MLGQDALIDPTLVQVLSAVVRRAVGSAGPAPVPVCAGVRNIAGVSFLQK